MQWTVLQKKENENEEKQSDYETSMVLTDTIQDHQESWSKPKIKHTEREREEITWWNEKENPRSRPQSEYNGAGESKAQRTDGLAQDYTGEELLQKP